MRSIKFAINLLNKANKWKLSPKELFLQEIISISEIKLNSIGN